MKVPDDCLPLIVFQRVAEKQPAASEMEEKKKKKKSPKAHLAQAVPASAVRKLPVPASKSTSFSLGMPHLPSPKQGAKFKRANKEKPRAPQLGGSAGAAMATPLQHLFLTDVSDVYEMEGGLLNLLNDFHSGKLQAFGKECSFEQLEHVREMQEKLARLHFSRDVCVEELAEDQKKTVADRNLDQLLTNLEELSNSIQKLHLAENPDLEEASTVKNRKQEEAA
ncbi:coiled-coil domain-containing protein 28B isoform X3 [Rhineura floridana]|uniref:coiled-coil domain-containing protein 28B isoform X3 n=1 Tax=Rhineura floridana TaxID=261503 RepID=UPI002AC85EA6|nr:coiled-coil domain-containing protein 28B isoform X3 [Rhineura floridana]XP_061453439.1 coiled-coil domain-containing protein 28B isoform X3 [Rhineura floridana]XP_061453440.1 coiled-coil domain-containing protein 28B isoform X3 [Rhineura floridana]